MKTRFFVLAMVVAVLNVAFPAYASDFDFRDCYDSNGIVDVNCVCEKRNALNNEKTAITGGIILTESGGFDPNQFIDDSNCILCIMTGHGDGDFNDPNAWDCNGVNSVPGPNDAIWVRYFNQGSIEGYPVTVKIAIFGSDGSMGGNIFTRYGGRFMCEKAYIEDSGAIDNSTFGYVNVADTLRINTNGTFHDFGGITYIENLDPVGGGISASTQQGGGWMLIRHIGGMRLWSGKIGAYEFKPPAFLSDLNSDGKVDFEDFAIFAYQWQFDGRGYYSDIYN